MPRDYTQDQFERRLAKYGMSKPGLLGYVSIGGGVNVSALNGGSRRRDQLAYLIEQQRKAREEGLIK